MTLYTPEDKGYSLLDTLRAADVPLDDIAPVHAGAIQPGGDLGRYEFVLGVLVRSVESTTFQIARLICEIEQQALYKQAGYKTMSDYYPALLAQMKSAGRMHRLAEKTVREWVRIYKLFICNLEIPEETVLTLGTGHFTALAEAADYSRSDMQIKEQARPGKLGRAEILERVAELKQAQADNAPITLEAARNALDASRGVEQRYAMLQWGRGKDGAIRLMDIAVKQGDTLIHPREGCSREIAEWLNRQLHAVHNLAPEGLE